MPRLRHPELPLCHGPESFTGTLLLQGPAFTVGGSPIVRDRFSEWPDARGTRT